MDTALAWAFRLRGKSDQENFKELGLGVRTWDFWNFNEFDQCFGDDWQGEYLHNWLPTRYSIQQGRAILSLIQCLEDGLYFGCKAWTMGFLSSLLNVKESGGTEHGQRAQCFTIAKQCAGLNRPLDRFDRLVRSNQSL